MGGGEAGTNSGWGRRPTNGSVGRAGGGACATGRARGGGAAADGWGRGDGRAGRARPRVRGAEGAVQPAGDFADYRAAVRGVAPRRLGCREPPQPRAARPPGLLGTWAKHPILTIQRPTPGAPLLTNEIDFHPHYRLDRTVPLSPFY